MAHLGLLNWANSIRRTMASDPGRQVFKDEVQTHGFLFLDDYLDNIVSGAKQDPLIELVKTPGRKKAVGKRPKLMSSKLATTVSLSINDDVESENVPLANPFAPISLLTSNPAKPLGEKGKSPVLPFTPEPQARSLFAPTQPISTTVVPTSAETLTTHPDATATTLAPPVTIDRNDLSIIAEDEEPSERTRASTTGRIGELTTPEVLHIKPLEPSLASEQVEEHNDIRTSSSTGSLHSALPLSPSIAAPRDDENVEYVEVAHTVEEDSAPADGSVEETVPESIAQPSMQELNDAQDFNMEETTDRKSHDKHAGLSIPTLPDPTIIRKPSGHLLTATMMGAATPGAGVVGKRTSWLMTARAVKAMEGVPKKSQVYINTVPTPASSSQGTKRKSDDSFSLILPRQDDEERQTKVVKTAEGECAPRPSKEQSIVQDQPLIESKPVQEDTQQPSESGAGVLDRLKKTVEGLGFRSTKAAGKSLGGDAATLLAEARRAAEARIAERDRKEEEMTMAIGLPSMDTNLRFAQESKMEASTGQNDAQLNMHDLFPSAGKVKEKHKVPEKPFQFKPILSESTSQSKEAVAAGSASTTPAHSPSSKAANVTSVLPPVFNKQPPVFVAPAPSLVKPDTSFTKPIFIPPPKKDTQFSSLTFKPKSPAPLTAHSTIESLQSDKLFDDDVPTWMPETQDTEYTAAYDTESQPLNTQLCDEDDSWPMDEKLAAGVQWTFGGSKEDSMTWSTQFTHSQRADTGPVTTMSSNLDESSRHQSPSRSQLVPGAFDVDMDEEDGLNHDAELEEIILGGSKSSSNSNSQIPRSESQLSLASTESAQSQVGFLGQASKLISSALGTGKKKQPEVKTVLYKAAIAAKKQQEETDKKAARLKEMENRRQLALQRKADEEKARALEEERKTKEEADRRKKEKEKEGNTEKRALKLPSNKKEEESQKKRKIEAEKKPEIKKPGPSGVLFGKGHLKTPLKKSTLNTSTAYGSLAHAASSSSSNLIEHLGKGKEINQHQTLIDDDVSRPTQHIQSAMAARAKAQIDAAKHVEPPVPSESIELPDINSEYSDSEDEDRVRTFDPPDWAQSPELRQALENQRTINPDDIFGAVRPLKMEEIFKTRTSRFRARTSSANWTGADQLTMQEESEYARRMGFKK